MKVTKKKGEIPYLERDISWMYFNRRILSEAEKAPVPLLERLSFLGIYSNNLDEFYRVRVATLNRIIEYEDKTIKTERETAIQTFREISRLNALYTQKFEETFTAINTALRQNRIYGRSGLLLCGGVRGRRAGVYHRASGLWMATSQDV